MQTENKNKKRIWLIVLLLLICVAATTFTLMNRMCLFMPDLTEAIDLTETGASRTLNGAAAGEDAADPGEEIIYGFEASDESTVWGKETEIEIFRITYENGQAGATVKSSDGDSVIAPGTENSYTFTFTNTGNVALDYHLDFEAVSAPEGVNIPVEVKLSGDDGWVVGDEGAYADTKALNEAEENATLGAGRYKSYTFNWQWAFEGDDELDTMLGSMAAEQDVTYTVKIMAVATASADPDSREGSLIIQTGDTGSTMLWILLGISAMLMIFLLLWKRDDDDEAES